MPWVTDFPFITRTRSPDFDSTLITSAPWSARIWVHNGPTTTEVRSTTRTPSSGPPDMRLPRQNGIHHRDTEKEEEKYCILNSVLSSVLNSVSSVVKT